MKTIDTLFLEVMPRWNRYVERSFKFGLPEGISPPMHFLITHLHTSATMSDFARVLRMSKQQMTKLADKVIDMGYAERESDPNDRRMIHLRATKKAEEYMFESKQRTISCFQEMVAEMDEPDEQRFMQALDMMNEVFIHMEQKEYANSRKETE